MHIHTYQVTTSQLSDPLRIQNDDVQCEKGIIQGCEQGILLEKPQVVASICGQRGTEAVLWLAMELVYIDSWKAQTRRSSSICM